MKALASKNTVNESLTGGQKTAKPLKTPVSTLASLPIAIPYIQRKPLCACDGGCPRCSGAIQAKLTIGQPNDKYEQESDRIADQVMRMPEPKGSLVNGQSSLVQRQAGCTGPTCDEEEEEEEPVQAKSLTSKAPPVTSGLQSQIQSMKGGGQPLPDSTRAFFESCFGRDFSDVKLHMDAGAAEAAQSLDAAAFTTGNHIVFGDSRYTPGTPAGQRLLAHELTHVVQQCDIATQARGSLIQCYGFDHTSPSGDRLRVDTEAEDPTGEVRPFASATIISDQQDSIPYNIRVDTVQGHRPVSVMRKKGDSQKIDQALGPRL
jgi:hypothetical protein